tara:strand:+ start:102 stop:824 length:723 start_codon:yes stop_codon:yes gene_type:complete
MSKIHLPVDLLIINTLDSDIAFKTLNYCDNLMSFNRKIIISNEKIISKGYESIVVPQFKDIQEYSELCLKLIEFTSSGHVLIVQDDGHIVNPEMWDPAFLNYDYIGAPWPTSKKWLKRFKKYGDSINTPVHKNIQYNRVGNGGFSLRSRKFLEYSATFDSCENIPEDIFLCLVNYERANSFGISFAPFEMALRFSYESGLKGIYKSKEKRNEIFNTSNHFGWHGKHFVNSSDLMKLKFNI